MIVFVIFLRFLLCSGFRAPQTALFGAIFRYNTPAMKKPPTHPPRPAVRLFPPGGASLKPSPSPAWPGGAGGVGGNGPRDD